MTIKTLKTTDIANKRVIIRQDLNVPIKNGVIQSYKRIYRGLSTIQYALQQNSAILILSHLGNPQKHPEKKKTYTLQPIADALSNVLEKDVALIQDISDAKWIPGTITLLENTRFFDGEISNNSFLSQKWARACDVFIMDAFGAAHRKHASINGIAKYAKMACAGFLMEQEIKVIDQSLKTPKRPLLVILGGAKISTKIHLISHLIDIVDDIIIGGAMANTCLAAKNIEVGQSLCEHSLKQSVCSLLNIPESSDCQIHLPVDVKVAKKITDSSSSTCSITEIDSCQSIFDVGPQTLKEYQKIISAAETILWNGPVGAFEYDPFSKGTYEIAKLVAKSNAYSLVGGGDTIHALERVGKLDEIDFASTGGGAFLEYLSGNMLPGTHYLNI